MPSQIKENANNLNQQKTIKLNNIIVNNYAPASLVYTNSFCEKYVVPVCCEELATILKNK